MQNVYILNRKIDNMKLIIIMKANTYHVTHYEEKNEYRTSILIHIKRNISCSNKNFAGFQTKTT